MVVIFYRAVVQDIIFIFTKLNYVFLAISAKWTKISLNFRVRIRVYLRLWLVLESGLQLRIGMIIKVMVKFPLITI